MLEQAVSAKEKKMCLVSVCVVFILSFANRCVAFLVEL